MNQKKLVRIIDSFRINYLPTLVEAGALVALAIGGWYIMPSNKCPSESRSEPLLKQIGSNEARAYYIKWSQEIDGKENIDPGATFVYVDEKPYGSLDYIVKLEPRGSYNRATGAWSPSQEDMDNFKRISE